MLVYMIHTLCCVATCSVLYEDVVERLVGAIGELLDPHGGDPLLTHGALWVPAVDHTVITRPGGRDGTGHIHFSILRHGIGRLKRDMLTEKRAADSPLVFHDEAD